MNRSQQNVPIDCLCADIARDSPTGKLSVHILNLHPSHIAQVEITADYADVDLVMDELGPQGCAGALYPQARIMRQAYCAVARAAHLHNIILLADLQRIGSGLVRWVSGTDVPDAPSGFRAYNREAALRLNILTSYSYTLETVIQAGKQGLRIYSVPVKTNPPTRPSRLQRSSSHFIFAQASTILRLYAFYEPLRTFAFIAAPFLLAGTILLIRFLIFYIIGERGIGRHVQSLTIGIGLFLVGIGVLGAGAWMQEGLVALAGSVSSGLFIPAMHYASRMRREKTALRLLQYPLSQAETGPEAAKIIQQVFSEAFTDRKKR